MLPQCTICYSELSVGNDLPQASSCGHVLCATCRRQLPLENPKCPLKCRKGPCTFVPAQFHFQTKSSETYLEGTIRRHVHGLKQAAEDNENVARELGEEIRALEKKITVQRVRMTAHNSNLKEVSGDTENLEDRIAATYASCRKEAKAIEALRLAVLEAERLATLKDRESSSSSLRIAPTGLRRRSQDEDRAEVDPSYHSKRRRQ